MRPVPFEKRRSRVQQPNTDNREFEIFKKENKK
jgi:hypothetical protein